MARPSGRRRCVNVNSEVRSRARASRSSAVSFFTRRRSFRISCWSSGALRSRHLEAHRDLRGLVEPPTCRRARHPEVGGDGHIPGALDKISQPVVVALLRVDRGRHADNHRPFAHAVHSSFDGAMVRRRTTTRAGRCRMSVKTARGITRVHLSTRLHSRKNARHNSHDV